MEVMTKEYAQLSAQLTENQLINDAQMKKLNRVFDLKNDLDKEIQTYFKNEWEQIKQDINYRKK